MCSQSNLINPIRNFEKQLHASTSCLLPFTLLHLASPAKPKALPSASCSCRRTLSSSSTGEMLKEPPVILPAVSAAWLLGSPLGQPLLVKHQHKQEMQPLLKKRLCNSSFQISTINTYVNLCYMLLMLPTGSYRYLVFLHVEDRSKSLVLKNAETKAQGPSQRLGRLELHG